MAEEKKEQTVAIKKSTLMLVLVAVICLVVGFGAGWIVKPQSTVKDNTIQNNDNPSQIQGDNIPSKVEVSIGTAPVLGSNDAKVTIIEYSDFECPFCGRFYTQSFLQIKSEYIDKGKVKLAFKDFPLSSIHPNAQKAAEAAKCAGEQGKYWEMHDMLFEKQGEWSSSASVKFKEYAKTIKLDEAKFASCLDTSKYQSDVQKDFNEGSSLGVSGTPSFFINGIQVVGAQPYTVFKQIIDQELAK